MLRLFLSVALSTLVLSEVCAEAPGTMTLVPMEDVVIDDAFWSPRFNTWMSVTVADVMDKFEGKGAASSQGDAIDNFRWVAAGERNTGRHVGPPWFDGLIYETIRAASDLLQLHRDTAVESRLDGWISAIAAAQTTESDGFINTYTQLTADSTRWGEHGGLLRWQHDVYNAGALIEAGVHHYQATGKTTLLVIATRMANLMCSYMGWLPKHNVVPAHSLPEEAMIKLYWLYSDDARAARAVKRQGVDVEPDEYLRLAEFWIDARGHHCGEPLWGVVGNEAAERWIRSNAYAAEQYGAHSRPSFGPYAQDSVPLTQQKTIEGHAVRATLYMTGVATAAIESGRTDYTAAAIRLWDNMVGERMFISGGVGAVAYDEKFGGNYYLPNDAYLETCAAVGLAFYSQRMNQLTCDAKYIDEFERALYNNVLTGISTDGRTYTYQNPLTAESHNRWQWHGCPCCPPMFLKLMSAMPGFAYGYDDNSVYVNLFLGSTATIDAKGVTLTQNTNYPSDGTITITVDTKKKRMFDLKIRIPGWSEGCENPYGLYFSNIKGRPSLSVNGESVALNVDNGYAVIHREWRKGDTVVLTLPMEPRLVVASSKVESLRGMTAVAAGPVVYAFEQCDNADVLRMRLLTNKPLVTTPSDTPGYLGTITCRAKDADGMPTTALAVPYYAVGNRHPGEAYTVWMKKVK